MYIDKLPVMHFTFGCTHHEINKTFIEVYQQLLDNASGAMEGISQRSSYTMFHENRKLHCSSLTTNFCTFPAAWWEII